MDFFIGQGTLRYEGFEGIIPVRVFLDTDFDLKVETTFEFGFEVILLGQRDDLSISILNLEEPIKVFMVSTGTSSAKTVFQPKRSPIWRVSPESINRGRVSLINFGGQDSQPLRTRRLLLEAGGWSLQLIPVGDGLAYSPSIQNIDYIVTHQLEFHRTDCGSFTATQMEKLLETLGQFFSFCQGSWVGIGCAVGMNSDGEVITEEWGVGRVGPYATPDSFLDSFHVQNISELFPLFLEKFEDEGWADTISHAIYWLRRSNMDNAGTDGGIVLLKATLERFCWHLLVRDREAISEKGFNDLVAADQLRLMISMLRLPKDVPVGLEELGKFAKSYGLDAAEAFTRVRNRIVHPPKLKAAKEGLPFYDTYRLGRWLVELAVLATCGYQGKYSNRTRKDQWVGQVENVPWAS